MKTRIYLLKTFCVLSAAALIVSCNKNDLTNPGSSSIASSNTIAVAASSTTSTASTDSVYLVQPCQRHEHRDSIAQSSLPSPVTSYLFTNYNGYSFAKAFALKNSSSAITGYVVVIYYNNNPVGDSSLTAVEIL